MREPKFSDAPCYGKEFDAKSKICGVCLANQSCQRLVLRRLGVTKPGGISALQSFRVGKRQAVRKSVLDQTVLPALNSVALLGARPLSSAVPSSQPARRDAA
jgi:hypothetical protein